MFLMKSGHQITHAATLQNVVFFKACNSHVNKNLYSLLLD